MPLQEDGVAAAVQHFHLHLPLNKLAAGERVEWHLAHPTSQSFLATAGWRLANLYHLAVLKAIEVCWLSLVVVH